MYSSAELPPIKTKIPEKFANSELSERSFEVLIAYVFTGNCCKSQGFLNLFYFYFRITVVRKTFYRKMLNTSGLSG